MLGASGWEVVSGFGRGIGEALGFGGGDRAEGDEPADVATVAIFRGGGVAPGVEARGCLGKSGEIDTLGEGQRAGGFVEVRAGGGFGSDEAIAVGEGIQVANQDVVL